jgi:hypothetical protein
MVRWFGGMLCLFCATRNLSYGLGSNVHSCLSYNFIEPMSFLGQNCRPGYFSPEYAKSGQLTEKVDVYGFGVLVLEIVSGRKNTDFTLPKENVYLVEWVCTSFDLCKINGFKCFQKVQSWSISCDHSNLVCIVGWLYKIMFYGHGYRHGSCMRMGEYWILSK